MPIKDPDHMHTITLSRKALVFLTNCMSFRGGTHPGDEQKFKEAWNEAQDALLNAFGTPPVETCSSIDHTTVYSECDGKHQSPVEALTPTRDDLLEEIDEAWKELAKVVEIPGAEVYSTRGGPLWEAVEVLRLQLKQAKIPPTPSKEPVNQKPLRFYKVPDPWGIFSNFSRHPLDLDGKTWPSTEHFYQSAKFMDTDPEWAEAIRLEPKCGVAASMGRDRSHTMREGWDEISYHVMNVALFAKFTQHPDCQAILLASGHRHLIEDTRQGKDDDHIWGDGSTGTGKNLLGKGLMRVREAIRQGLVEEYLNEDLAKIK